MKNKYFTYALGFIFAAAIITDVNAQQLDVSQDQLSQIQNRVDSMSISEIKDRRAALLLEKASLEDEQTTSQSPAILKEGRARLDLVRAELWVLVGALVSVNALDGESGYSSPPDNTPPVITINGDNPATVELGAIYTDAGAYANDGSVVTSSGTVDSNTVGSYTITYSATDFFGNTSTATRIVNVVDTTAPVVTVTGDNPATAELGDTYTDAGATATDASGTVTVVTTGSVDTDTLGSYTLTYTSTDASGNAGTTTRIVNVVDTTAPVFTSLAGWAVTENQTGIGTVTATDLQVVTFSVSGSELLITSDGVLTFVTAPDYEVKSVYTATVTATDASLNAATQDIEVYVEDVGGIDDDPGTGTGTGTGTGSGTSTGTGVGTNTGVS